MPTHPLFPTREQAAENPGLVLSDHLPIITQVPINSKHALRIVSLNTMQQDATQFSGSKYNEGNDQNRARCKRILGMIQNINTKQSPHVFLFQETTLFENSLKNTLGKKWKVIFSAESNMFICFNKDCLSRSKINYDATTQIFSLKVQHTATGKTIALHNVSSKLTPYPHVQEKIYEEKLTNSINEEQADIAVLLGNTNSSLAPTDTKERNITTCIIPTKFVNDDPVLGPILHQHFKDENEFYMLHVSDSYDMQNLLTWLQEQRGKKHPILIKKGNEYFMYGNSHGTEWSVTKIEQPSTDFNDLTFPTGMYLITDLPKKNVTLGMCRSMIAGDANGSLAHPGHTPTLLFPNTPDGGFLLTNKKGAHITQLKTILLKRDGEVYDSTPATAAPQAGSIEEALLSVGYKAIMCLDRYYEQKPLIANWTIFEYEKKVRHIAGNPNIHVRATANYLNQRGIVITFPHDSCFYAKIKEKLKDNTQYQFVSRLCPATDVTYQSVFAPANAVVALHNAMVDIMNSDEFKGLRRLRNRITNEIDQRVRRMSQSLAISSDAKVLRAIKIASLNNLRREIYEVLLDQTQSQKFPHIVDINDNSAQALAQQYQKIINNWKERQPSARDQEIPIHINSKVDNNFDLVAWHRNLWEKEGTPTKSAKMLKKIEDTVDKAVQASSQPGAKR